MPKIIKLPVSFETQRRLKLQKKEAFDAARSIVQHELFKLSLLRCFQTPF